MIRPAMCRISRSAPLADHDGYFVYTGGSSDFYGGTSVAAPTMAGIVALLNQYLVSDRSRANRVWEISIPRCIGWRRMCRVCFTTSPWEATSCRAPSASPGCNSGSYGYSAGRGYDQATGLGSPDAFNLVHQWTNAPARDTAVVVSFDQNPVFQMGSSWPFVITLTEEAGVGTTLTSLTIDKKSYDIATTFGTTSLAPNGSVSSQNLSLTGLSVPANVAFTFDGRGCKRSFLVADNCRCPSLGRRCS